jgi:hypothetical protein
LTLTLFRKTIDPFRSFAREMPRALGTKNRVASVVLGCALLFGAFLPSLVVLQFQLNREEIIRTRCVQRFRPMEQNSCKGRCHLQKQLQEQEATREKDPNAPPRIELRTDPAIALQDRALTFEIPVVDLSFAGGTGSGACAGYVLTAEPVPWQS